MSCARGKQRTGLFPNGRDLHGRFGRETGLWYIETETGACMSLQGIVQRIAWIDLNDRGVKIEEPDDMG